MDTFYPPEYRVQEKIQEYIDNALDGIRNAKSEKEISAINCKALQDLDRKDYDYFIMLLKEELGE